MKENLKTTQYRNGTSIDYPGSNNNLWESNAIGAYAWYDNDLSWKERYGALYNWHAVNNSAGLCPTGWHVPNDDEWTQLIDYVVAQGFPNQLNDPNGAGNALKSCRQVDSPLSGGCNTTEHPRWSANITHHGFDAFGFSALPGGYRYFDGAFYGVGDLGFWWSSTLGQPTLSWLRYMGYDTSVVTRQDGYKTSGFNIRCIKD